MLYGLNLEYFFFFFNWGCWCKDWTQLWVLLLWNEWGKSGNLCLKKRTQEKGWQGRVLGLIGVGWGGKKKETVGVISVSPPASARLGLLRMWWGYFTYKHTHTEAYTQTPQTHTPWTWSWVIKSCRMHFTFLKAKFWVPKMLFLLLEIYLPSSCPAISSCTPLFSSSFLRKNFSYPRPLPMPCLIICPQRILCFLFHVTSNTLN